MTTITLQITRDTITPCELTGLPFLDVDFVRGSYVRHIEWQINGGRTRQTIVKGASEGEARDMAEIQLRADIGRAALAITTGNPAESAFAE